MWAFPLFGATTGTKSHYLFIQKPVRTKLLKPLGMVGKWLGTSNLCAPNQGHSWQSFCFQQSTGKPNKVFFYASWSFTQTVLDGNKLFGRGLKSVYDTTRSSFSWVNQNSRMCTKCSESEFPSTELLLCMDEFEM